MPESVDIHETISFCGETIRDALYRLKPRFGIMMVALIILALRIHGMPLTIDGYYNISQIQSALTDIFGSGASVFVAALKGLLFTD